MNQETFEAVTAEFKIPNACNDIPYHRRQHEQAERLGWLCTRATGLLQFLWAQGLLQYRAQLTELTQKAVPFKSHTTKQLFWRNCIVPHRWLVSPIQSRITGHIWGDWLGGRQ